MGSIEGKGKKGCVWGFVPHGAGKEGRQEERLGMARENVGAGRGSFEEGYMPTLGTKHGGITRHQNIDTPALRHYSLNLSSQYA